MPGAWRVFQQVAGTYVEKGDHMLITRPYTSYLLVEIVHGVVREIPKTANNHIIAEAASDRIEDVIREFGKPTKLLYIDHVDYQFGNMHDITGISKVAHQYDVPVLYNVVYTVGRACSNRVTGRRGVSHDEDDWRYVTGRTFDIKEVGIIVCSLIGAPIVGMLA